MQTIAGLRGRAPLAALQIQDNLAERRPERGLLALASGLGLDVLA